MGPISYLSTYDETDGSLSGVATLVRLVQGPAVRISVSAWISDDNVPVQEFTAQLFSGVCEASLFNSRCVFLPSPPVPVARNGSIANAPSYNPSLPPRPPLRPPSSSSSPLICASSSTTTGCRT